jgi:hypothetical protein
VVPDREERHAAGQLDPRTQAHGAQVATPPDELSGDILDDRDPRGTQRVLVTGVALEVAPVGHDRDRRGPRQHPEREPGHVLAPPEHHHVAPTGFVPVAHRAVEDARPVVVEEAGDVGELVLDTGGEHEAPGVQLVDPAARDVDGERVAHAGNRRDCPRHHGDLVVRQQLVAARPQELERSQRRLRQVTVRLVDPTIAVLAAVHHHDRPAVPCQPRGRRQPAGSTAHDHRVHASHRRAPLPADVKIRPQFR